MVIDETKSVIVKAYVYHFHFVWFGFGFNLAFLTSEVTVSVWLSR